MKKSLVVCMAAMLVLAASCKKNEEKDGKLGFRASLETPTGDSKTHMDGLNVKWDAGNTILVINGNNEAETFTTQGGEAAGDYADFTGTEEESFFTPNYMAYYPSTLFGEDGKVSLLETQTYAANSFANGANPMAAQSTDEKLEFRNLCGILDIPLKGTCQVTSISITSNNEEEMLWGKADLNMYGHDGDMEPSLSNWTDGTNEVILNCGDVELNDNEATHFYIILPAGSLASGFKMTVTCSDGTTMTLKGTSNTVIERSKIRSMEEVPVTPEEPVVPTVETTTGCVDCEFSFSGKVTVEGTHNCEYGFVYAKTSDNTEPEIGGTGCTKVVVNTENINTTKDFTADLAGMGLTEETDYTMRAYAICNSDPGYGACKSFVYSTTTAQPWPEAWGNAGHSTYEFTVASGKTVYFSRGNLQYLPSSNTWQFAAHQFDVIDKTMGEHQTSIYVEGGTNWIDLFGWGTTNNEPPTTDAYYIYYHPWDTHSAGDVDSGHNLYGYGPSYGYSNPSWESLSVANGTDWGVNPISNGGNVGGQWRTLTRDELNWLLGKRSCTTGNSYNHYGMGKIGNCIPGLIILPDNWDFNAGLPFNDIHYTDANYDEEDGVEAYNSNRYSYLQWAEMEAHGAIFLPAAGGRDNGTEIKEVYAKAWYWLSTISSYGCDNPAYEANELNFKGKGPAWGKDAKSSKYFGASVRLVQDK